MVWKIYNFLVNTVSDRFRSLNVNNFKIFDFFF